MKKGEQSGSLFFGLVLAWNFCCFSQICFCDKFLWLPSFQFSLIHPYMFPFCQLTSFAMEKALLMTSYPPQFSVKGFALFSRFVFQKGVYSIFIWPGTSWFLCWWCIALVNKNLRSLLSLVWYKWLVPFNFSSLHIHRFLLLIFQEEKFYKSKGKLVLFSNSYMYLQILLIRCWSFSLLA